MSRIIDGRIKRQNFVCALRSRSSSSDDDDSSDDSSDDHIDFNIFFSVSQSSDFEDLNDDWDIMSITENRIELRDSGENGGIDVVVFERS